MYVRHVPAMKVSDLCSASPHFVSIFLHCLLIFGVIFFSLYSHGRLNWNPQIRTCASVVRRQLRLFCRRTLSLCVIQSTHPRSRCCDSKVVRQSRRKSVPHKFGDTREQFWRIFVVSSFFFYILVYLILLFVLIIIIIFSHLFFHIFYF